MEPPDALTFNDDVVDPSLTAVAATIDYTFGRSFDGFWVGAARCRRGTPLEALGKELPTPGKPPRSSVADVSFGTDSSHAFVLIRHKRTSVLPPSRAQ
jgi:hypothetical protein